MGALPKEGARASLEGSEGMELDDLLCSRNARSRTPLARANGTSRHASGWAGEKVARSGRSISPHPWRVGKQAWRKHTYHPMRAVKGNLGHSSKERHRGESPWLHIDVKITMLDIHVLNCGSGGVRSPVDELLIHLKMASYANPHKMP